MAFLATKANNLKPLAGSIPDNRIVMVADPATGELFRTTFGQLKSDVILAFGGISYLDPIQEYDTFADFPNPGAVKTLYVITTGDLANTQWRWSGSMYIEFPHGGDSDVSGEALIRGNADIVLQANIDAETAARQSADATLQTNITAEATSRANADITLQNNISAEANARNNADQNLQTQIDALELSAGVVIDDTSASATKVYSSEKVETLLTNRILVEVKAGTAAAIAAGIIVGSKTYTNLKLAGRQCEVNRGGFPIAGIDLGNGTEYAIKDTDGTLNSVTITFLSRISDGEYIKIKLA